MIWMGLILLGQGIKKGKDQGGIDNSSCKNLIVPSFLPPSFLHPFFSIPPLPHVKRERGLEKRERKNERSFFFPWHLMVLNPTLSLEYARVSSIHGLYLQKIPSVVAPMKILQCSS